MSHYYGGIQGNRLETTRGGSKNSGFTAWAQDAYRQVRTVLTTCEDTGRTWARVTIQRSSINYGHSETVVLFDGFIDVADNEQRGNSDDFP